MKWGNFAGSRRKNIGVLLNTQSRFPSSVLILRENPCTQIVKHWKKGLKGDVHTRGSRAVSADPDSPPTVENRTVKGDLVPTVWNTFAEVISESEWVDSKYP